MNFNTLKILDGFGNNLGDGAIVAVVSIALVFLILGIIIFITYVAGYLIQKALKNKAREPQSDETRATQATEWEGLDVNDEDAVAAVIAASIDYREETKKNVRVVKVREIK